MHLFYTPGIDPLHPNYILNEEESKHCIRVLRLENGSEVHLIDGKGGMYTALIQDAHPKRTVLKITSRQPEFNKRNHFLHVAFAPTKNIDRVEWFLEKATEIGIDELTPVICQRSERKEVKTDRLNKIITAAIKQSLKAYHPTLNEAVSLSAFLSRPFSGQKYIAHCEDTPKADLRSALDPGSRYLVLVGPEGDFAPDEIEQALQNGFKAITLGNSRLRTETAALEACFEVNFLNRPMKISEI